MMSVTQRDDLHHTYADYLTWSRSSGDELIEGTAYIRDPGPTTANQIVVVELCAQVRNALRGTSWRVFIAPLDVRLPRSNERDEEVDTVVQPDLFITRGSGKVDCRGMRGAPDWIVEVLSPGTARYDQKKKLWAYERARVPEVWLVNARARSLFIYRLSEGSYRSPGARKLEG